MTLLAGVSLLSVGFLSWAAYLRVAHMRRTPHLHICAAAALLAIAAAFAVVHWSESLADVLWLTAWFAPALHAAALYRRPAPPPLSESSGWDVPDPTKLDRPMVGWVLGGVTPEGVLDVADRPDYRGDKCAAGSCGDWTPRASAKHFPRLVPKDHSVPAPFCTCGLFLVHGAPYGLWQDRYRDRVGYRMRTAAVVSIWGRVMLDGHSARGQEGRVLALLIGADETSKRRARIESAARRLNCQIIEVEADAGPEYERILQQVVGAEGIAMEQREVHALLRRKDQRRWHTLDRHQGPGAVFAVKLIMLAVAVGVSGLVAVGLPVLLAVALAGPPAILLAVHVARSLWRRMVEVELLAASPDGEQIGEPIVVVRERRGVGEVVAAGVGQLGRSST